ncbi:helix-turn-helix domain-containing protein [uncultured Methylobacterium sp.]|uniref:helix-turn-helix domain-containing protein n=1 Tax=uncultured Methylobacterium sp. TaxID=157278 RepID=UPI002625E4CF|nr:helix-turn-helix domain-containing protein [uncultured Methylobacterium sp.]
MRFKVLDIIDLARRQPIPDPVTKCVFNAVCARCDEHGECFPSQKRLAADTAYSERAVRKALSWLESEGFLTREGRHRPDGSRSSDLIILDLAALQERAAQRTAMPVVRKIATGTADHRKRHHVPDQPARRSRVTTFEHTEEQTNRTIPPNPPESVDTPTDWELVLREQTTSGKNTQVRAFVTAARATEERFNQLLKVYPREGIVLADLPQARRIFGDLNEAEQLHASVEAEAYGKLLARRQRMLPKALHSWLRQERYRNTAQIQSTVAPAKTQRQAFLSRQSKYWDVANTSYRAIHGKPLPAYSEHRGNAGHWLKITELPNGYIPALHDERDAPFIM